jgi:hypothetical protein
VTDELQYVTGTVYITAVQTHGITSWGAISEVSMSLSNQLLLLWQMVGDDREI